MNRIVKAIDYTLTPATSPLAYLVALHSFLFGSSFVFFGWSEAVQAAILFKLGALVTVPVWGIMLTIATLALLIGMFKKSPNLTMGGGFIATMCWIFAVIVYFMSGFWFQGMLAVVVAFEFGYYFLAASLGRLWDYTPSQII